MYSTLLSTIAVSSFFALGDAANCAYGNSDGPWRGSYNAEGCTSCVATTFNNLQTLTCVCNGVMAQINEKQCPSFNVANNVTVTPFSTTYGTQLLCQGPWQVSGSVGTYCSGCQNTLSSGGVNTLQCNCNGAWSSITDDAKAAGGCPTHIVTTTNPLDPVASPPTLVCLGQWTGAYPQQCTGCSNSYNNGVDTLSCNCRFFPAFAPSFLIPASITSTACPTFNVQNNNGTLTCTNSWRTPGAPHCTCGVPVWTGAPNPTGTVATPSATVWPTTGATTVNPLTQTISCTCDGVTTTWNDKQCPSRHLQYDPLFYGITCNPWNTPGGCTDCFNTITPSANPTSMTMTNNQNTLNTLTCNCGTGTTTLNSNLCPTMNAITVSNSNTFTDLECAAPGWSGNYSSVCSSCGNTWSNAGTNPSNGVAALTCVCQSSDAVYHTVQMTSQQCPWLTVNSWNGQMMCMPWNGPYTATCTNCVQTVNGGVSTLSCQLCSGGIGRTTIDSNACPIMNVVNLYGELTCNVNWCQSITNNINWGQFNSANMKSVNMIIIAVSALIAAFFAKLF